MRNGRQTEWEDVDNITVPGFRHRHPTSKQIEELAEAIRRDGRMHTPITVRLVEHEKGNDLVLVAGMTRLEAAKKLGWKEVECFVDYDMNDVDAELLEITENLHRAGLTKEQRDEHIRRYAELIEAREKDNGEVSGQIVQKPKSGPKGGRPKETATKIAEKTGLSQRTVRRALKKTPADPSEKAARQEADRQRREQDKAIKVAATEEYAEWLLRQTDLDQLPVLISWIEAAPPRDLIAALRRLSDETPVMDRQYGT